MYVYSLTRLSAPVKILYFAFFAWFCGTGPLHPLANWDMLPYVGAVYSYTEKNSELRKHSLAEIKKYISEEQYTDIISSSNFRKTVANDDRAFIEQLPYRLVKPLYIFLTGLLGIIIGNIALASVIVSSTGFLLIGISLYLLRPRDLYEPFWLISVLGILYFGNPQLILLTQASTPDSLATGLMLMGFWAFLHKPESVYPMALMSLAILARPDFGVTTACLFPYFIKLHRDDMLSIKWLVLSIAIPMVTAIFSKVFFESFGYKILLIDALKGPFPYPSNIDSSNFMQFYLPALYNDFLSLIALPRFALFLIASLAIFVFSRNHYAKLIIFSALANAIAKLVFFPNFDAGYQERYFFLSYFLALFAGFNGRANPNFFGDNPSKAECFATQKAVRENLQSSQVLW